MRTSLPSSPHGTFSHCENDSAGELPLQTTHHASQCLFWPPPTRWQHLWPPSTRRQHFTSGLCPLGGSTFDLHILRTTFCFFARILLHPDTDGDTGPSPLVAVTDVTASVHVFGECISALRVARSGLLWHPRTMVFRLGVCPLGLTHSPEPDCLVCGESPQKIPAAGHC